MKEEITETEILDVMGHRIRSTSIDNPILKRIIEDRLRKDEFLFSYKDHSDWSRRERYSDYKEYDDHYDYNERHIDYSDCMSMGPSAEPNSP